MEIQRADDAVQVITDHIYQLDALSVTSLEFAEQNVMHATRRASDESFSQCEWRFAAPPVGFNDLSSIVAIIATIDER